MAFLSLPFYPVSFPAERPENTPLVCQIAGQSPKWRIYGGSFPSGSCHPGLRHTRLGVHRRDALIEQLRANPFFKGLDERTLHDVIGRALSALSGQGLIAVERHRIRILDAEALEKLAG